MSNISLDSIIFFSALFDQQQIYVVNLFISVSLQIFAPGF